MLPYQFLPIIKNNPQTHVMLIHIAWKPVLAKKYALQQQCQNQHPFLTHFQHP